MEILKFNKKGYTLMELILVVALFSVFLSIAIPSSTILSRYQENMELKILVKDLRRARSQAIINNENVHVKFHQSINEYEIIRGSIDKSVRKKLRRITITGKNFDSYVFTTNGVVAGAGTLHLRKSNGEMRYLKVTPITTEINLTDAE